MEKEKGTILLLKKMTGSLSDDEQVEYQQWLNASKERELLSRSLLSDDISQDFFLYQRIDVGPGLNKVLRHVRHKRNTWLSLRAVMAACLVGICVFLWFWDDEEEIKPQSIVTEVNLDTLPSGRHSTIIMSDRRVYNLDSIQATVLDEQLGVKLNLTRDRELTYTAIDQNRPNQQQSLYNIIQIPYGRPWKVTLLDSSVVWVNAGSILQLPVAPGRPSRTITLRGEGFFHVAELNVDGSPVPFIVKVGKGMEVRVTGTRFNVRGFTKDSSISTTLISGRIKVISNGLAASPDLGEAILINRNSGKMSLKKVDTSNVGSWINGKLSFVNTSYEEVVLRVARAHGVDVVFEGNIAPRNLTVSTNVDLTLEQAKNFLQLNMQLIIREVGNTWYVKRKPGATYYP